MRLYYIRNRVMYSYSICTFQCISYLTVPQCPLEMYCLSVPQCQMECLFICVRAQLGLREFNTSSQDILYISLI